MKINYNRIISILNKSEKQRFFVLSALSVLISIADILSLAFLFVVIHFYSSQDFLFLNHYLYYLSNEYKLLPAVLLLAVFILKSLGGYYVYKAQQKLVNCVSSRISGLNLLEFLEGNYDDQVNTGSATYVQRIYHQPIEFANYILSSFQQIITESVLVALSILALLLYSGKLLLVVTLVLLPAILILTHITKLKLAGIRKNIEEVHVLSLQYLREALEGFVESNIYDKNKKFVQRYYSVQSHLNQYIADMQIMQGLPSRFFETFAVFGLFVLIMAGNYSSENTTNIFKLGAFVAAAYKIIPGIARIINLSGMIKTYSYILPALGTGKVFDFKKVTDGSPPSIHSLEFRDVCFSYYGINVFSNLNFKIKKGMLAGITGKSGRGKTTLINVLFGFLSPENGNIFVNGKLTDTEGRKKFWKHIAYVKQEPFILNDSVRNNITLFDEDNNEEKLKLAIKSSCLTELIEQYPRGVDTIISEAGKNISGGQKQRIAIARALYKNADIIVLDEPFNELDQLSETKLLQNLKCLSKDKIIILITHSSKGLSFCDLVIKL